MTQLKEKPAALSRTLINELTGASSRVPGELNTDPLDRIAKKLGIKPGSEAASSAIASTVNALVALTDIKGRDALAKDALQMLSEVASAIKDEVKGPARYMSLETGPIEYTSRSGKKIDLVNFIAENREHIDAANTSSHLHVTKSAEHNDLFRTAVEKIAPQRMGMAEKLIAER